MRNNGRWTAILSDNKRALQEKYGVDKIGFCAWWTNKQEPTADLTIVVTLRKPMGWRFYALKDFLEYKLNCPIDLTTVEGIKPMVREEVLSMTKFV
jgi:predicted nucleotidyltransferase